MSERTTVTLADALALVIDHRGKTVKKMGADFSLAGHRVISAINIKGRRLDDENLRYVSEEVYVQWMTEPLRAGDVLLTSEAPLGELAYVERDSDACLGQRLFALRGKPEVLHGRYLFYALSFGVAREDLMSRATGTTVTGIRQSELLKVRITLPLLAEQRAIAGVLGALDDKIESNRRLTVTIDALLRAELEQVVSEDTETREVAFGDIASRVGDAVDPRKLKVRVPYIGLEHMPRGAMFLDEWGTSEGLGSGKSAFKKGDVLFGRLRPYFKKVGIAPIDGVCSTDVLVLRPAAGESSATLLALAASEELIAYASAAATGTKMPRVSWDYLAAWSTTIPGLSATERFDHQMMPLVEKAIVSIHERTVLVRLRDALLPELLSGRLRVRDAESLLEGV